MTWLDSMRSEREVFSFQVNYGQPGHWNGCIRLNACCRSAWPWNTFSVDPALSGIKAITVSAHTFCWTSVFRWNNLAFDWGRECRRPGPSSPLQTHLGRIPFFVVSKRHYNRSPRFHAHLTQNIFTVHERKIDTNHAFPNENGDSFCQFFWASSQIFNCLSMTPRSKQPMSHNDNQKPCAPFLSHLGMSHL